MRLWAGNVVFLEAAEGLRSALRLLGVAARIDVGVEACPWVSDDELWVLVGATLLPGVAPSEAPWPPPRRFVVYQMEQLGSAWLTPACTSATHGQATPLRRGAAIRRRGEGDRSGGDDSNGVRDLLRLHWRLHGLLLRHWRCH